MKNKNWKWTSQWASSLANMSRPNSRQLAKALKNGWVY